jgi:hypothetical protein
MRESPNSQNNNCTPQVYQHLIAKRRLMQMIELPIMIAILWWSVHNRRTHKGRYVQWWRWGQTTPLWKQPPIQRPFTNTTWPTLVDLAERRILERDSASRFRSIARTCRHMDPHSNYYVQSWIFMGVVEAQLSSAQLSSAQLSSIDRPRGTS